MPLPGFCFRRTKFRRPSFSKCYPFFNEVDAASNTTAYELLQLAAKLNPCYNYRYKQFSFGRYITTICCVEQNTTSGFYWFVYINSKSSPVGVDLLKPKDGDTLTFQYEQWKLQIPIIQHLVQRTVL